MGDRVSGLCGRAKGQVVRDLQTDPYLRYILVLATIMTAFWYWDLIPNFATQDEEDRLFDAMTVVGAMVADPSIDALQTAVTQGRLYGAVLYLNLLALIPAVLYAALTGHLDVFVPFYLSDGAGWIWSYEVDIYYYWQGTPDWVFTSSLVLLRLMNVLFTVGCVYLIYRIGTTMRDRATGRLAALLLTLTFGVVVTAHEGGEDIPLVFCLLLVVYLALRYVDTGNTTTYLAGCVAGGLAIGFKLSGAIAVVVLGVALLLRARSETDWRAVLVRPRLIAAGLALGAITIAVGYPSIPLEGLDPLIGRVTRASSIKGAYLGGRVAPLWWWFLRSYLGGLGLPLFLAGVGGTVASVVYARQRSVESAGIVLLWVVFGGFVLLYLRWKYVHIHHLLPTFPAIILVISVAALRLRSRRPRFGRVLIALLIVTSALYTGVGTLGYATQPRDEAATWLQTHAAETATAEVYVTDVQDVAVPHGMNTSHYQHGRGINRSMEEIPPRTDWMLAMPQRCPEYIVLTYNNLLALAPPNRSEIAKYYASKDRQQQYIRDLLYTDRYPYAVAAEFGPRPAFLTHGYGRANEHVQSHGYGRADERVQSGTAGTLDHLPELLRVGVIPRTRVYGDEQDTGPEQYTVILERTGRCTPPTNETTGTDT